MALGPIEVCTSRIVFRLASSVATACLVAIAVEACQSPGADAHVGARPPAQALEEAEREAEAFFAAIPDALRQEGPAAWLRHFSASAPFFMASDGELSFASHGDAAAFLAGFAPEVRAIELSWREVRVDALSAELATVAAAYAESISLADGSVSSFGGFVTGVVERRQGEWTLRHLHWSSPVVEDGAYRAREPS